MTYFVSLVCIIKDEDYLEEFIIYHYLQGVQHFFIYDNESSVPIKQRLNHYFYHSLCTIIDFPGKIKQIEAYNHCLKHYGKKTNWLIIIDGDEFIYPKLHKNLVDFLKDYDEFHAIGINWVNFGSSHFEKKQKGYLTENYIYCQSNQNKHIKTICKPTFVDKIINPHYVILNTCMKHYIDAKKRMITDKSFNEKYTIDIIQINHYWGKSYEEMNQKIERGRATMNSKRVMPKNYHELYNDKIDESFKKKFIDKIDYIAQALNTHPKIYKLLNPDLDKYYKDDLDKYTIHLINNGIKEKRPFKIQHVYKNFNIQYYKKNYDDLKNLNYIQLIEHYLNSGLKENRVYDRLMN